jgi:hypothetical protein
MPAWHVTGQLDILHTKEKIEISTRATLPVALYWYPILSVGHRLNELEYRVLRKMLGHPGRPTPTPDNIES